MTKGIEKKQKKWKETHGFRLYGVYVEDFFSHLCNIHPQWKTNSKYEIYIGWIVVTDTYDRWVERKNENQTHSSCTQLDFYFINFYRFLWSINKFKMSTQNQPEKNLVVIIERQFTSFSSPKTTSKSMNLLIKLICIVLRYLMDQFIYYFHSLSL